MEKYTKPTAEFVLVNASDVLMASGGGLTPGASGTEDGEGVILDSARGSIDIYR